MSFQFLIGQCGSSERYKMSFCRLKCVLFYSMIVKITRTLHRRTFQIEACKSQKKKKKEKKKIKIFKIYVQLINAILAIVHIFELLVILMTNWFYGLVLTKLIFGWCLEFTKNLWFYLFAEYFLI